MESSSQENGKERPMGKKTIEQNWVKGAAYPEEAEDKPSSENDHWQYSEENAENYVVFSRLHKDGASEYWNKNNEETIGNYAKTPGWNSGNV